MGATTKIDWCDATWNPVTGCLHGCEYCYARKIAERFKGCDKDSTYGQFSSMRFKRLNPHSELKDAIFETSERTPPVNVRFDAKKQKIIVSKAPYPWGFQPTLHRDLLYIPQAWKKPKTIFVCSMADLFGNWVPDEWIKEVFHSCEKAPQHRYIFLTKNPKRYYDLIKKGILTKHNNWWLGSTIDSKNARRFQAWGFNSFTSIEPIMEYLDVGLGSFGSDKWVIIGAETGNRKGKVIPEKAWIDNVVEAASITKMKVFMKESLRELMGNDFRQEFPWRISSEG